MHFQQLEKERLERAQQQRETTLTTNTSIWGNASQSLTWSNNTAPWGVTPIQNNLTPGFWDEVASNSNKNKTKAPSSPQKGKSQTVIIVANDAACYITRRMINYVLRFYSLLRPKNPEPMLEPTKKIQNPNRKKKKPP